MATEEDLAQLRAAAVQAALDGDLTAAVNASALAKQVEEDQKRDKGKKKK